MTWSLLRKPEDLRQDPRYDFNVGHLVGAHIQLCTYLSLYGDTKGREIANRAYRALGFFYESEHDPLPELPPDTLADTVVIPEKKIQDRS